MLSKADHHLWIKKIVKIWRYKKMWSKINCMFGSNFNIANTKQFISRKICLIQIAASMSDWSYYIKFLIFRQKITWQRNKFLARFRIFDLYDHNNKYYVSNFYSELKSNFDLDDALWSNFAKSIWKKVNGFGKVNDFVHLWDYESTNRC